MTHTDWEREFIESGADLEHARWARWQAYLHSKCVEHENGEGEWVCFPSDMFRRWQKQIETPYQELSESEKESDRREVREYIPLIRSLLKIQREEILREVADKIGECTTMKEIMSLLQQDTNHE